MESSVLIMKKSKVISLLIIFVLIVGALVYAYDNSQCELDGLSVCFDKDTERFLIEEEASLSIQIGNEGTAELLQTKWNALYPQVKLEIEVLPILEIDDLVNGLKHDVVYLKQKDAAYFMQDFFNLGYEANEIMGSKIPTQIQDASNVKGMKLLQTAVTGPLFMVNQTLADELGFTDLSSFESIFAQSDKILENMEITYPISFVDQFSMYPYLTSGGWLLNRDHMESDPEFSSPRFLKSLEFIEWMGQQKLTKSEEKLKALDYAYNNEASFFAGESLFGIVSDFELARLYEESSNVEYKPVPFPKYGDHHLSQLVDVEVYAVNANTLYPSASAELFRILRDPEIISEYSGGDYAAIYHPNYLADLKEDIDPRIRAYAYGDTLPILALKEDPSVLVASIYRELDLRLWVAKVFDGEITPLEAQAQIVQISNDWLKEHGVNVEITDSTGKN